MTIQTKQKLYIRGYNTSTHENSKSQFIEIPIGTKLNCVGFGDECKTYSSDPVKANLYSCNDFGIENKFLYTNPESIWSFYDEK